MKGIIPWIVAVILLVACFVYMGGLRNRIAIGVLAASLVAGLIVALLLRAR